MAAAEDARAANLHGLLVWCIGLVAGAIFLAGTMATGAMSAGTAGGSLAAAQRNVRAESGRPPGPAAVARGGEAVKFAAAGAGGGALAAIAGLLGAFVGARLSQQRVGARLGRGFTIGSWRLERREQTFAQGGDRGHAAPGSYGAPPRAPGSPGMPESEIPPPTDPYHH
jgi:hypothetical protein